MLGKTMFAFTSSFHKPIQPFTPDKEDLRKRLQTVYREYGGKSHAYKNMDDFILCKYQLLSLLQHCIEKCPKLTLLKQYKANVAKMTESTSPKEVDITLRAAKNLIESYLPLIEEKGTHVDVEQFNSREVTLCLQGAFSNLAQAFLLLHSSSFELSIAQAKQNLIFDLISSFVINETDDIPEGNQIHFATTLLNYVAHIYHIPEREELFVITPSLDLLEGTKQYLEKHFLVSRFISFFSMFMSNLIPQELNTEHENYNAQEQKLQYFFECLGEEEVLRAQYSKLYEETMDLETNHWALRLKQNDLSEHVSYFFAEYLERKGYISGVSHSIADRILVTNGENIVQLKEYEGYFPLTPEETLFLLQKEPIEDPTLLTVLYKNLDVKCLWAIYTNQLPLASEKQEQACFDALLSKSELPHEVLNKLCQDITFLTDNRDAKINFFKYLIINTVYPLSDTNSLLYSINPNHKELKQYFCLAAEHNRSLYIEGMLKFYPLCFHELKARKNFYPLHFAAVFNANDVVIKLIELNYVDPNDMDGLHITAGYIAAEKGNLDLLKKLNTLKADLSIPLVNGSTPMFIAAQNGHLEVVKFLLQSNQPFNIPYICTADYLLEFANHQSLVIQNNIKIKIEQRLSEGDYSHAIRIFPKDIAWIMDHHKIVEIIEAAQKQKKEREWSFFTFYRNQSEGEQAVATKQLFPFW